MTQQANPRAEVVETLKQKLPDALGTAAMPGTEGWSLDSVRTERFFGHAVVSLTLVSGDRRHDFHLFPANSLEEPYYRDDRFDFVYIDNADENRGKRDRAVVDQFGVARSFRPDHWRLHQLHQLAGIGEPALRGRPRRRRPLPDQRPIVFDHRRVVSLAVAQRHRSGKHPVGSLRQRRGHTGGGVRPAGRGAARRRRVGHRRQPAPLRGCATCTGSRVVRPARRQLNALSTSACSAA